MTCKNIVTKLRVDDRYLMSLFELINRFYTDRYILKVNALIDWDGKVIEVEDPENINEDY